MKNKNAVLSHGKNGAMQGLKFLGNRTAHSRLHTIG